MNLKIKNHMYFCYVQSYLPLDFPIIQSQPREAWSGVSDDTAPHINRHQYCLKLYTWNIERGPYLYQYVYIVSYAG